MKPLKVKSLCWILLLWQPYSCSWSIEHVCITITNSPFSQERLQIVIVWGQCMGLYPEGFVREYVKINILSFLCDILTRLSSLRITDKYILHTINWLPYGTTFLREFNFFDRRYITEQ